MAMSSQPVQPPLRRTGTGLSDVGRKRQSNEDAFFFDDRLGLYIVGDGMGGHAAGEIASQEAVETVYGMVKRGIGNLHELADPVVEEDVRAASRLMESSIQAATYMVFSMAEMDRGKTGMGTTLSALLVLGEYAVTAQVGDSRIYRVQGDAVEQLTEDHTLIAWQLSNLITPQEAKKSPHRNVITRASATEITSRSTPVREAGAGRSLPPLGDGLHGYLRLGHRSIVALSGEEADIASSRTSAAAKTTSPRSVEID